MIVQRLRSIQNEFGFLPDKELKELAREIKRLEKEMVSHARNLEFEKAAEARDQLHELRKRVFGVEIASD